MLDKKHFFRDTLVAKVGRESSSLKNKEISSALGLPAEEDRQIDLQYMNAIFVSSGMNKNGAVFLGSELLKAHKSISTKAVDVEHNEKEVIGHIAARGFLTREGEAVHPEEALTAMSQQDMDDLELDVAISAVVYKDRFPEIAESISNGEWMVSMECYYRDYDIKVGDLIIPRDQAEQMGYDKLVGKVVQVKKGMKDFGFHMVGRVLRDIIFSGVGIVKDPANERSIIMESAAYTKMLSDSKEGASIIDVENIDKIDVGVGIDIGSIKSELSDIKQAILQIKEEARIPKAETRYGNCVSFKRYVYEFPVAGNDVLVDPPTDLSQYPLSNHPGAIDDIPPGSKIIRENYCNLFDLDCPALAGDSNHPNCWRHVLNRTTREEINSYEKLLVQNRLDANIVLLTSLVEKAKNLTKKRTLTED
jgi:hypothetical protein